MGPFGCPDYNRLVDGRTLFFELERDLRPTIHDLCELTQTEVFHVHASDGHLTDHPMNSK